MANKQTLVAQAKKVFQNFSRNKPKTDRLRKEMCGDVELIRQKFIDLQDLVGSGEKVSFKFTPTHYLIITRMQVLMQSVGQFREKLKACLDIESQAAVAMKRFIRINMDESWRTLSRSDILELRVLFKKDLRITKFQELNVDKLEKEWDRADIVKSLDYCYAQVKAMHTELTTKAAGNHACFHES